MKTRISNYNELKLGIRVNNLLIYINYIKFAKTSYHKFNNLLLRVRMP